MFIDFSKAFDFIHRKKIEQILLAYSLSHEIVTTIMMLYKNTNAMAQSPDGDTDFFDIVTRDTLTTCLFILCLDNLLQTSIDLIKENGSTLKKARR